MGFNRLQSVTGLTDEMAHEGAKDIAAWADALSIDYPHWWFLEACGLVPYESAQPPKIRAEHSPAIKYNRPGQS